MNRKNEEGRKNGDGVESERDKRVSAKCRIFVRRTSGPPATKKESFLSELGQKKIRWAENANVPMRDESSE